MVWLSFLVAAFVAGLAALSYAELASIFPKAGAEYVYSKKALGFQTGFTVGWMLVLAGILSAAMSLSCHSCSIGYQGSLSHQKAHSQTQQLPHFSGQIPLLFVPFLIWALPQELLFF